MMDARRMSKGELVVAYERALSTIDKVATHMYQADLTRDNVENPLLEYRAQAIVARLRSAEARLKLAESHSNGADAPLESLKKVAEHLTRLPVGVVPYGYPEYMVGDLVDEFLACREAIGKRISERDSMEYHLNTIAKANEKLHRRIAQLERSAANASPSV